MTSNNINFRSVNEVATAESLADGDKVLLNSNGVAKQIDASKIGGSGGGNMLYAMMTSATTAYIYADEGYTRLLPYDEAKKYLMEGATFIAQMSGNMIILTPLVTTCIDANRTFQTTAMLTELTYLTLYCDDSATDE